MSLQLLSQREEKYNVWVQVVKRPGIVLATPGGRWPNKENILTKKSAARECQAGEISPDRRASEIASKVAAFKQNTLKH